MAKVIRQELERLGFVLTLLDIPGELLDRPGAPKSVCLEPRLKC
jgi:hypothetical protein